MEKENVFYATGKRKNGIARTWLTPGSGKITVNEKPVEEAFPNPMARLVLASPLALVEAQDAYDINVKVKGGGIMGQAGAIRHGITKALLLADPELRDRKSVV